MLPENEFTSFEAGLSGWQSRLEKLGLAGLSSMLVHASRPLAPILAQFLYIADPLIPSARFKESLANLGAKLEDENFPKATSVHIEEEQK